MKINHKFIVTLLSIGFLLSASNVFAGNKITIFNGTHINGKLGGNQSYSDGFISVVGSAWGTNKPSLYITGSAPNNGGRFWCSVHPRDANYNAMIETFKLISYGSFINASKNKSTNRCSWVHVSNS